MAEEKNGAFVGFVIVTKQRDCNEDPHTFSTMHSLTKKIDKLLRHPHTAQKGNELLLNENTFPERESVVFENQRLNDDYNRSI